MAKKIKHYPHNEITDCLEKVLSKLGVYEVHKNLEDFPELREELDKSELPIDPRLPVDLICAKKEEEETEKGDKEEFWHYTLFLVNSTNEISKLLKDRLIFYQFYLTRIPTIQPNRLRIVVAIPYDFDIEKEDLEFFKDNGFGLWKINVDKSKKSEKVIARNVRDRMSNKFIEIVKKSRAKVPQKTKKPKKWLPIAKIAEELSIDTAIIKDAINKNAQDFVLFFEEYIEDAVEGCAGTSPEQFGKRYIDRELLNLVLKLKNFSYQDDLISLINTHMTEKGSDYDFSKNCFDTLWKHNFNEDYPLTLANFEALLQQFFPTYREHFIHQLQVFLLGTIIIGHLFKNPEYLFGNSEIDDIQKINFSKSWLLTSSIHDFTYPLQKYDEWSSGFFKEQLNIEEPLSFLELKNIYVEEDFSTCTEYLLSQLKNSFIDTDSWQRNKFYNAIRRFCYYEKTEKKNHGLIGSFYLQKKFKNEAKFDREFKENILLPSAVALAMHDDEIWQILGGQVNGNREQIWKYVAEILGLKELKEDTKITRILKNGGINDENGDKLIAKILRDKEKNWVGDIYSDISYIIKGKPLSELHFKNQPLAFLLILCDNLQDYGRPCEEEERKKAIEAADIRLKKIASEDDSKTINIQLFLNENKQSLGFIKDKLEIWSKIEKFLKSPDRQFIIEYWDREKPKLPAFSFTIH